jgi:hypothetical protein
MRNGIVHNALNSDFLQTLSTNFFVRAVLAIDGGGRWLGLALMDLEQSGFHVHRVRMARFDVNDLSSLLGGNRYVVS